MTDARCPLCDHELDSLYLKGQCQKGFHYWCSICKHGWYVADLKNFTGMCLKGKREEARQIILKQDGEK